MQYDVEFRPSVLKSLIRLPRKDLLRIKRKIEDLARNLPDRSTTKMRGDNTFHRVRSGNYRIIYAIHDERLIILVVRVGHRKDVYKSIG